MIRIERDPGFWVRVARHPAVLPSHMGADPALAGARVQRSEVMPFASDHGGWLFVRLDAFGLFWEAHAMFTPEGWGREAHAALKATLRHMFAAGAQAIMVQETPIKTSRPPLSFGFRAAGPHRSSAVGPVRAWILTLAAWRDSPAQRRA